MKIDQETANQMVLKDNNYSGFVVGGIFLPVGIIALFYVLLTFSKFSQGASKQAYLIFLFPIGFIVIGLYTLLTSFLSTIYIDKTTNKITTDRKGILGRKVNEFAFTDVENVTTRIRVNTQNKSTATIYQTILILKDGREIPLDKEKSGSTLSMGFLSLSGGNSEIMVGQKIAAFIGVPFIEPHTPNPIKAIENIVSGQPPVMQ